MPNTSSLSALLAVSLAFATTIAACGPPAAPVAPSGAPGDVSGAPGAPGATSAAAPPGTVPGSTPGAAPGGHGPRGPMKPPVATAMGAELQAIGLDPAKLPALSKLEGDKLRKVMKLFTRSLGVKCIDCHVEDFAAPTPNKHVAEKMWDEFARGLSTADGQPVFCDSCHQGHMEFLDRQDKKALGKWMDDHYVGALKRRDGKEHECATCHGDPFEGEFLKEWARAPKPGNAASKSHGR